ncbi:MAG: CsgG/HfaB family protein [Spirochaetia bacterium]|jgi:PBP1b-binding outer membrane lipoprotein LpoB|nr:CsgG/HfaB family protein [Spirochaetia bacterium]
MKLPKLIFGIFWAGLLVGCASAPHSSMKVSAGVGESEIIVMREKASQLSLLSLRGLRIYIDGEESLVLGNGETGKIVIADGDHVMQAVLATTEGGAVNISANSKKFTYKASVDGNGLLLMDKVSEVQLNKATKEHASVASGLSKAANVIMAGIKPQSRIAIVFVTASDKDVAAYIAEELEFVMLNRKFVLVDRRQLNRLRAEQKLQLSGEVDDETAVSVGKLSGANVIITGSVSGAGNLRRLRLRALDTQTGRVIVAASEKY